MSCKPNGKEKENEYEQEKTGAFRVNWLLNKFWYLTEEKKNCESCLTMSFKVSWLWIKIVWY